MDKRYQVFVSSTFADLQDERQRVMQVLMEMDCIPAGMELFPAIDEEQFEFIKRVIQDCDYYILIIGGRYGSLTKDGVSYTEKEFDYAKSLGIKVLSFIHKDPGAIPLDKSEVDPQLRQQLVNFREKARSNAIVKFWATAAELPHLVLSSLNKTIRTYPAVGWVRANKVASDASLQELVALQRENAKLKEEIQSANNLPPAFLSNIAEFDEKISVDVTWQQTIGYKTHKISKIFHTTWSELFAIISPDIMSQPPETYVKHRIGSASGKSLSDKGYNYEISHEDFQTVKVQFIALGLINVQNLQTTQGGVAAFWSLTDKGRQLMLRLRSVKTTKKVEPVALADDNEDES